MGSVADMWPERFGRRPASGAMSSDRSSEAVSTPAISVRKVVRSTGGRNDQIVPIYVNIGAPCVPRLDLTKLREATPPVPVPLKPTVKSHPLNPLSSAVNWFSPKPKTYGHPAKQSDTESSPPPSTDNSNVYEEVQWQNATSSVATSTTGYSHWLFNEQDRLAKLMATEKLKTVLRLAERRHSAVAGWSALRSNLEYARDMEVKTRLDGIIEQRRAEVVEWEAKEETLRSQLKELEVKMEAERRESEKRLKDCREECTRRLTQERSKEMERYELQLRQANEAAQFAKSQHAAEVRKLTDECSKNVEKSQQQNAKALTMIKGRMLTQRRKLRLVNFCVSVWRRAVYMRDQNAVTARLRISELIDSVKHLNSDCIKLRTRAANAEKEVREIKNAIWNVWTTEAASNDRKLKRLTRGICRILDHKPADNAPPTELFKALLDNYKRKTSSTRIPTEGLVH